MQDVYDMDDIETATLQDYGINFAIGLRYEQYLVYNTAAYGTLSVYEQCYTEECYINEETLKEIPLRECTA